MRSALDFIKVTIGVLPQGDLESHVEDLVSWFTSCGVHHVAWKLHKDPNA